MKPTFPIVVLALTGLVLPAFSQGEPPRVFGDGGLPAFLKQFDVKGNADGSPDGILDEEERQAMRESLAKNREDQRLKWDTNGDGVLSPEEIAAARESVRERIENRRMEHFLKVAGQDGMLSLEEFLALQPFVARDPAVPTSIFLMMDTDKDGLVSADEFTARLRPRLPQMPLFRDMDVNPVDAKVSVKEWVTAAATKQIPESAAREMFAHLDRDRDGFIIPTEMPNLEGPTPPPPVLPPFRTTDMNGDQRVYPFEFSEAAKRVGIPDLTSRTMFKSLDSDANGWLSAIEYAAAF
jgi:Ca2+-binding EF-hand superfamily protein